MEYFGYLTWEFVIVLGISAALKIATTKFEGIFRALVSACTGVLTAIVFTPLVIDYADFTPDNSAYIMATGSFLTIAGENFIRALQTITPEKILENILKRLRP
jgi:purine-cytosine permease-like protein